RAAEAQRQVYEGEIARLQAALAQGRAAAPAAREGDDESAAPAPRPDSEMIEALRSENLRLRAAWEELANRPTDEAPGTPDSRLAEVLEEQDRLHRQLEQIQDERRRELHEHRATVAEMQAQLSRASLVPTEPPTEAGHETKTISSVRDEQLRFQAL